MDVLVKLKLNKVRHAQTVDAKLAALPLKPRNPVPKLSKTLDNETIKAALKGVKYPGFSRDIVSFGLVRDIDTTDSSAKVSLAVTTADPKVPRQLKADVEAALKLIDGISKVEVQVTVETPKRPVSPVSAAITPPGITVKKLPGVRHTIAIASGKGGVGKTTFAVNLACALERLQAEAGRPGKIGIMDTDIYGPTVPLMIGIDARPDIKDDKIQPLENFGVLVMSMGLLIDEQTPVVWRGPMVSQAISQFVNNVQWGELDILIVDFPPGTGDAQLSVVQTIVLDGVIIVTTPQAVAVNVARRGARMFEKVNVPLIGVAENMSYLEDKKSAERSYPFGEGGGRQTAADLGTELLGQVPLDTQIREGGDRGIPVVVGAPESTAAKVFREIAVKIADKFSLGEETEKE